MIKSYYAIGENVDKYMNGAYVLEFTERVLSEGVPAPGIFHLLLDFFDLLESRDRGIGTLVLGYQIKLFKYAGVAPQVDRCVHCGEKKEAYKFSIPEGRDFVPGMLGKNAESAGQNRTEELLHRKFTAAYIVYDPEFGIVNY